jgi:Na+/H+-dicarboxylate symporter
MKKIKLHTKIFTGLVLGVMIGLVFGEKAEIIEPIGTFLLRLVIMFVVPLVLISLKFIAASLGNIRKSSQKNFHRFYEAARESI